MNVYLFFESYNYGIRLGHFKPVPKSFPCLGWFPSAAVGGKHVAGAASEYSEAGSNCGRPGRISVTNFLHSYTPRQIATCTLNLNSVYLESRLYMQCNWINLCFHNMIIYIYQFQLFGSKVILAATHEQALLFPWERGWAGGQFDLVKFVSRSIKKNGPYIPVKCVWRSVHETKTQRSNNRTPQEPWTVHTNDLHPRCQIGNLLSTVRQPSLTPTSIRSLDGGSAGLASVEMRSMYRLTFTSRANFQKDPTNSHKSSRAE